MNLVLSRIEDLALWDSELKGSPQSNIYCSGAFLQSLGCRYRLYMVADGGRPLLGCPVLLNPDGSPRTTTHPYAMYQGPWFTSAFQAQSPHSQVGAGLEVLDFLLASLEKEYAAMHFDSHWLLPDLRSFSWFHYGEPNRFQIDLFYSGIVDCSAHRDFSGFLASLRKTRRQEYRALDDGSLTVEAVSQSSELGDFLRLYKATFDRQKITVSEDDSRLVEAIARGALGGGYGTLYLCRRKDGRLVSAALFLRDTRTSYYQFGANDPECRDLPGGSLVVLSGIRAAMQDGLLYVDMVGMNSPSRGGFKASFNARPRPYFSLSWQAGRPRPLESGAPLPL